MTNMSIQPLWLTYFIEILLVLEFQLTKNYFGMFSYKAHFRPQISSNELFPEPFLYHFKEINWIDTHWRGTRRRSPVKGVNSVINFYVCGSLILCFSFISVYSCCFSILFWAFNFCQCCSINQPVERILLKQTFNALKLRSDGSCYGIKAGWLLVQVCECLLGSG